MRIDIEVDREIGAVVRLSGRLDARCIPDVRSAVIALLDTPVVTATNPTDVVVDVAEVQIGDAAALGLLLECHRRAVRQGRSLVVINASDRDRRLIRRSRLSRLLDHQGADRSAEKGVEQLGRERPRARPVFA